MNKKLKLAELNRLSISEYAKSEKDPIIVILDNIRSLNNVGSIFRTCDAFAVEKLFLCGITAQPPHREIRKTAIGATESVNWEYAQTTNQAIESCKALGYDCYAIEQTKNSISLDKLVLKNKKIALILGNEVDGVSQDSIDICNGSIEVPQWGTKHSFNVSVTTGIVLWEIKKSTSLI
ncbi:MAG: RNA methyltransferase [Flavobacteriales bacterium]|nr:RNA methyltransferase [Flavobacteriales bacterium]